MSRPSYSLRLKAPDIRMQLLEQAKGLPHNPRTYSIRPLKDMLSFFCLPQEVKGYYPRTLKHSRELGISHIFSIVEYPVVKYRIRVFGQLCGHLWGQDLALNSHTSRGRTFAGSGCFHRLDASIVSEGNLLHRDGIWTSELYRANSMGNYCFCRTGGRDAASVKECLAANFFHFIERLHHVRTFRMSPDARYPSQPVGWHRTY